MSRKVNFYQAPMQGPPITNALLIEFPAEYVPHTLSALESRKNRVLWIDNEAFSQGLQGVNRAQWSLLMDGLPALIEGQNRIYRLLDTIHNGTVYSVQTPSTPTSPAVVEPAIPDAPPADVGELPGLRRQLLEMQGETPGGWLGFGGRPATIADLLLALRAGTEQDIERVNTALDTIVGAGSGATIFNTVRSLLTDTAELGAEGGILAVLIASTMAQAAMAGLQGAQLDALNTQLQAINTALQALRPAGSEATIVGAVEEVRDLLTPEPYSPIGDDV